jgi:hypothetical protein
MVIKGQGYFKIDDPVVRFWGYLVGCMVFMCKGL